MKRYGEVPSTLQSPPFLLLLMLAGLIWTGFASAAQVIYVHDLSGEVRVAKGVAQPEAANKNQSLESDTVVTTGPKSHVVIKFEDGQVIALRENSSFHILDYRYDAQDVEKSNVLLSFIKGGLRAISGLIGQRRPAAFQVRAPQATIGIRGTEFLADIVNPLYVSVVQGAVTATNTAGAMAISAGEFGMVASAATLPVSIAGAQLPASVSASFSQLGAIAVPPPTPVTVAPGAAAAGGVGLGTAVGIGAAIAAGVAAAGGGGGGSSTTTHH